MARIHWNRKACAIMTAGLVILTIIFLRSFGAKVHTVPLQKIKDLRTVDEPPTLELLHVVFRHGPRTPTNTYPTDPHINETFYPYGWGHLTNSGKRELSNIGTWLRRRYSNFLDSYYQPDLVHTQATGVPRTLMSLETVLAAMFPPRNTPMEWNPKINWQPIPVFSQPLKDDTLLLVRTACPRYFEALQETLSSETAQKQIRPFKQMMRELTQLTGMNITEPEDVQSLFLTLLAEEEYGLSLPDWAKWYYPGKMLFLAKESYLYNVWTREMQKLKAGPFLTKMFNEMSDKSYNILSPKSRKLFIYTGHDSTIVNIMMALNIWTRQMPRYSSMIIFELHKQKYFMEYFVEIYFSNNPKEPVQKLTVPGCEFQCPLKKLIELSEDVLIDSIGDKHRCEARNMAFTEPPLRGP